MSFILYAICIIAASGLLALLTHRRSALCNLIGATGAAMGGLLGAYESITALWVGTDLTLRLDWSIPLGSFYIGLDALSAAFLFPIFVLGGVAAVFGHGYMSAYAGKKDLGVSWFFYSVLFISMIFVVLARNAVLFLVSWELMSLASFFLVTFEHEEAQNRRAGWIYLVATHVGTAFLLVFFLLMGKASGSLDLDSMPPAASSVANMLFLLALVGFGTKAGFVPMHFWLPEAHPAAPSHVSALMSGVMIKTGIYGLLRTITLLPHPPLWWGFVLIGLGLSSGIIGVLFALAQRDLKRLLAYSSIENIGIIAIGLGTGLTGASAGIPAMAVFGFAGAILHVINHAFFKGLLFLGAGSVMHGAGTRNIEELGGLFKRMPWTGTTFLVGAIAICGLPPFNGFISEMLIFLGAYHSLPTKQTAIMTSALIAIAALALIGGLAAACFARVFGMVFLGEPRSERAGGAHESGASIRWPMVVLAAGCAAIGLLSPLIMRALLHVVIQVTGAPVADIGGGIIIAREIMLTVVGLTALLILLALLLMQLRRLLLTGRSVRTSVTWDCGYAAPSSRMQYTASSFAQPLVELFRGLLRPREKRVDPQGFIPGRSSYASHTPDLFRAGALRPLMVRLKEWGSGLLWLQHGRVQLYVLYIAITLLILLVWKLS